MDEDIPSVVLAAAEMSSTVGSVAASESPTAVMIFLLDAANHSNRPRAVWMRRSAD